MAQNFMACDREQAYLMPPSLLEWMPEDHLVWSILGEFYADYGVVRAGRRITEDDGCAPSLRLRHGQPFLARDRAGVPGALPGDLHQLGA